MHARKLLQGLGRSAAGVPFGRFHGSVARKALPLGAGRAGRMEEWSETWDTPMLRQLGNAGTLPIFDNPEIRLVSAESIVVERLLRFAARTATNPRWPPLRNQAAQGRPAPCTGHVVGRLP